MLPRLLFSALLAALCTSMFGAGWRERLLVAALLFPLAACWTLLAAASTPLVGVLRRWPREIAAALLTLHAGSAILVAGAYLTNLLVVDSPWGPWSLGFYAATAVTAAIAVWLSLKGVARFESLMNALGFARVLGGLILLDGAAAALLDGYGIRPEYRIHGLLFHLTLAGFAFGWQYLLPRRISLGLQVAAAGLVVVACAVLSGDRTPLYRGAAAAMGTHGRVLAMARAWTDGDGDGFSPWFDGGDCDDQDPSAYPLSSRRDCLGWRRNRLPPVPPLPQVQAGESSPRLILLLTIDAFRCGFEVREEEPLRSACPNLTRMAKEGWARLDAHTSVPNTASSLTIMMTGNPTADPLDHPRRRPTLPQRLREGGYHTSVLVSYPLVLKDVALKNSFDEIDYEFRVEVNSPFEGDRISLRVAEKARAVLDRKDSRAFLWAHYPDAHFPFMVNGSPFKHSGIADYAHMIRRTDDAIGLLLAELAQHPAAADVLVLVASDHGEEFFEHGERYHGFTLYEEGVRVPILAWSPVDHRRFLHSPPPVSNAEIGDYLLAAVGTPGAPPRFDSDAILLRTVLADSQYGVISGGWKLIYNATRNLTRLFDLSRDPNERHDLAAVAPEKVGELGSTLGSLLSPLPYGRTVRQARTPGDR